jgi:hypothetical protein
VKIVIFYRKPKHHKDYYPWQEIKDDVESAITFIENLSDDYDYLICKEISLGDLYDYTS